MATIKRTNAEGQVEVIDTTAGTRTNTTTGDIEATRNTPREQALESLRKMGYNTEKVDELEIQGAMDLLDEPLTISSDNERQRTSEKVDRLRQEQDRLNKSQQESRTMREQRAQQAREDIDAEKEARRSGGLTFDEVQAAGASIADVRYDETTGLFFPVDGSQSLQDNAFQILQDYDDRVLKEKNKVIDEMEDVLSMVGRDDPLVRAIERKYEGLYDEARTLTDNLVQQHKRFGARFGTTRYAPLVATGIISAEQREGVRLLNELAAEESQLIAEAVNAERTRRFDIITEKIDALDSAREKQRTLLTQQLELSLQKQQKIQEANQRISREAAILGIIDQGYDDIADVYSLLNYDENGNQIGDISLEEIDSVLSYTTEEPQDLTGDVRQYEDAKRLGLIPENMDYFTFLARESSATRKPTEPSDDELRGDFLTDDFMDNVFKPAIIADIKGSKSESELKKEANKAGYDTKFGPGLGETDVQDYLNARADEILGVYKTRVKELQKAGFSDSDIYKQIS